MNKFPFTDAGFQELQHELYQLDDAALAAEALQIAQEFTVWLPLRFELTDSQLDFLAAMDERALDFIAQETSYAVGNRLPVSLEKDPPKDGDQGKIIYTKSSLTATYGKPAGFSAGGSLLFHISY